jgi:hypothetical protein
MQRTVNAELSTVALIKYVYPRMNHAVVVYWNGKGDILREDRIGVVTPGLDLTTTVPFKKLMMTLEIHATVEIRDLDGDAVFKYEMGVVEPGWCLAITAPNPASTFVD